MVLVGLLKDFSVAATQERAAGKYAYDFSWMWDELGINPSNPTNARTHRRSVPKPEPQTSLF